MTRKSVIFSAPTVFHHFEHV